MSVNWVTRNIRRMVWKWALERWETKLSNCKVILQAVWPIAESLWKRNAIHCPLTSVYYSIDKANIIAECLENQFRVHDLRDCDHSHVSKSCWLLSMKTPLPINIRPCDVPKEIQCLKLWKACGFDGIPSKLLWHIPRRPLVHLAHLFNYSLGLGHFPAPWRKQKS
jgi:hypothetical protein